jgi:hypothetical protein
MVLDTTEPYNIYGLITDTITLIAGGGAALAVYAISMVGSETLK